MRWPATIGLLALLGATGCGDTSLGGEGDVCVRASQCQLPLVCAAGTCTSDLSLLEGGTIPNQDAGAMEVDAGPPVDAGPQPDTGPPPMIDSGPPRDSGPPPEDSGPPPVDSGPPPMDSGPPPMDAGTSSGDGG
ncbi:MAG TPA: hypothetical protein RMH99_23505 [Sandaracinaceae bacterium LLY-WYZ-13_1]|nr:hypothetical protein [Sandaracinaceae bacterium LLY-WYZ-13_1]